MYFKKKGWIVKKEVIDFIEITNENIKKVAKMLKTKKGVVIIADPEYWSSPDHLLTGKLNLHLFSKATIIPEDYFLDAGHGIKKIRRESVKTGWENDRQYRLRQKPKKSDDPAWEDARNLFQKLSIDDQYQFEIAFQSTGGMGWDNRRNLALYIPRLVCLKAALTYTITWMTELFNKQEDREMTTTFRFNKEHVEQIVAYALEDLKTGEVFKHNVQAEKNADIMAEPA